MQHCRYLRKITTNFKSVIITIWFLLPSSEDFWRSSMPEECFSSASGLGLNLESRLWPVADFPFLKWSPGVKDFFLRNDAFNSLLTIMNGQNQIGPPTDWTSAIYVFCSSQPSIVNGWVALSFLVRLFVRSAMVTSPLLLAPDPQTHTFSESLW